MEKIIHSFALVAIVYEFLCLIKTNAYYDYYHKADEAELLPGETEEEQQQKDKYKTYWDLQKLYTYWGIVGLFVGPTIYFVMLFVLGFANHYVSELTSKETTINYIRIDAIISIYCLAQIFTS